MKTRTTPLRPMNNGMVEQFNWALVEELAKYCNGPHQDWDLWGPYLLIA